MFRETKLAAAFLLPLLILTAAPAWASDPAEVDIESLRGTLYRADAEWLLELTYDVEIEDYDPTVTLELVFSVTEGGRLLTDADGKPIQFVIPLDQPTDAGDDELEFESAAVAVLPDNVFQNPRDLKVYGEVYAPDSEVPLAYKEKSVKFKPNHRSSGYSAISVSGSYAYAAPSATFIYGGFSYGRPYHHYGYIGRGYRRPYYGYRPHAYGHRYHYKTDGYRHFRGYGHSHLGGRNYRSHRGHSYGGHRSIGQHRGYRGGSKSFHRGGGRHFGGRGQLAFSRGGRQVGGRSFRRR